MTVAAEMVTAIARTPRRQGEPGGAAEQRQQDALDEHLTDKARPGGAERRSQ